MPACSRHASPYINGDDDEAKAHVSILWDFGILQVLLSKTEVWLKLLCPVFVLENTDNTSLKIFKPKGDKR